MFEIGSTEDLTFLRETVSTEFKLAAGRDGQGALPEDFWPTYSAFANTEGGVVVLGVRERKGAFELVGVPNFAKVRADLFNCLGNSQKVSVNLLSDADVEEIEIDGKTLLCVRIPRAERKQRPVYLTTNPLGGNTYRRINESDRPLSDEDVKRMLAEQVEDSRDDKILAGYTIGDLDPDTLRAYRQIFSNRDPGHPWNTLGDEDFLQKIGGWRRDRESNAGGLTLAGLLMFGQMTSIQEALPYYMLDYQERPEAKTERRWVDRLTLDGKWSGNLFDFYRRVYLKLTADLKVPFHLEKGERQDETPVHVALREALANVLVHADYTERASVLVVKRPDMFGFRNPGLMRIPLNIALQGGEADCRNRTLHKMFRLVGVGEQAGTGIPRIFQGWDSQHWNPPKLYEIVEPNNQTLLELRMIDLFPDKVIAYLQGRFGNAFNLLGYEERVALALAASEGTVNHARLCAVSSKHSAEISRTLHHLTQIKMLESTGGRGAVYHLPGEEMPTPDEVFGPSLASLPVSSLDFEGSSSDYAGGSSVSGGSSSNTNARRTQDGYLRSDQIQLPIIDDLTHLSEPLRQRLEGLAELPRKKKRMDHAALEEVILSVCRGHYLTLQALSELVCRRPEALRNEYLSPMVRSRQLSLAFPTAPTHNLQAYCTTDSLGAAMAASTL